MSRGGMRAGLGLAARGRLRRCRVMRGGLARSSGLFRRCVCGLSRTRDANASQRKRTERAPAKSADSTPDSNHRFHLTAADAPSATKGKVQRMRHCTASAIISRTAAQCQIPLDPNYVTEVYRPGRWCHPAATNRAGELGTRHPVRSSGSIRCERNPPRCSPAAG